MDKTLSFRIPPGLRRDLARLSRRQQRPVSEVAREALRRYIAQEELDRLRAQLRPHAEAKGIRTDEDVFRAVS